MADFLITSTGTAPANLEFTDLGGRTLTTPFTNFQLSDEYGIEEIRSSVSLSSFLDLGYIECSYGGQQISTGDKLKDTLVSPFYVKKYISTGLTLGGSLSINSGDSTKFDISDGNGVIIDNWTDPANPEYTEINWSGLIAQTVSNLATQPVTYIALDSTSSVVEQSSPFTNSQKRTMIDLGVVVHSNNIDITVINNQPVLSTDIGNQLYDLFNALGFFTVNGIEFSPNGANLSIDRAEGDIFKQGSNSDNDLKNPHQKNIPASTAYSDIRYRLRTSGSEITPGTAFIDPNNYDNAGVLTAVPAEKYTVQRINIFSSGDVRLQYGQNLYDSLTDAQANAPTEIFVTEQNIAQNGLLRGFLAIKQGATDLSDVNEAIFINASIFGRPNETYPGAVYKREILNSQSTGLGDGGELSITPASSPATLDISAGYGVIVDNYTDPSNPTINEVRWPAFGPITPTDIATEPGTYVLIDPTGAIMQRPISNPPTEEDKRNNIFLGFIGHSDNINVINVFNYPVSIVSPVNQVEELAQAIGPFTTAGNLLSFTAAAITLNKSLGESFFFGGNFQVNAKIPSRISNAALNAPVLVYAKQDLVIGPSSANIDATQYDNAGTLTTIPTNNFTNARILLEPINNLLIFVYGQNVYGSLSAAKDSISTEPYSAPPILNEIAYELGILIYQEGVIDLTDPTDALFIPSSKFGSSGGGGGGGGGTSNLQTIYTNSPINPTMTTDATRGSLDIRTGSGSDTDKILVGQNTAGTETFSLQGDGDIRGLNVKKANLSAGVNPVSTDDTSAGYEVGSIWVNKVLNNSWICVDSTATSAIWIDITASAGGGLTTIDTGRTFWVDQVNGNDVTAIPDRQDQQYSTIDGALTDASIASGDTVRVRPGTYAEQGLRIPDGVSLISTGGWSSARIGLTGATNHIIQLGLDSYIQGFSFNVPTNTFSAIHCNQASGTNALYDIVLYGNGGTPVTGIGIKRTGGGKTIGGNIRVEGGGIEHVFYNDSGVLALEGIHVPGSPGDITNVIYATVDGLGNAARCQFIGFNTGSPNVTNAVRIEGGSAGIIPTVLVFTPNVFNCTNAISADGDYLNVNYLGGRIENVTFTVSVDPGASGQTATYRISANHQPSYNYPPLAALNSDFALVTIQETTDVFDSSFNIFGVKQVSVGFPERGVESTFGRGAPYTTGMLVIRTGAVNTASTSWSTSYGSVGELTDVTIAAKSKSSSTFGFRTGTLADETIMFGSQRTDGTNALRHWGAQIRTATADFGDGEFAFEIWGGPGIGWKEVKAHCKATEEGYSYGDDYFIREQHDETYRIGINEQDQWPQENLTAISIPGGGTCRWARIRHVSPSPTQAPTFERFKLVESGLNVSVDGVASQKGLAMFRKNVTLAGNLWGSTGNPSDISTTIGSTNSWTHKIKDSLLQSNGISLMCQFPIPLGTCTAYPINISILASFASGLSGTYNSGDQILEFYAKVLSVSGNLVAERQTSISGSSTEPIKRPTLSTEVKSADPSVFTSAIEAVPHDAVSGVTPWADFDDRVFKIDLTPVDCSAYYEEDLIAIRIESAGSWPEQLNIWGIIIEGVSHQDGRVLKEVI